MLFLPFLLIDSQNCIYLIFIDWFKTIIGVEPFLWMVRYGPMEGTASCNVYMETRLLPWGYLPKYSVDSKGEIMDLSIDNARGKSIDLFFAEHFFLHIHYLLSDHSKLNYQKHLTAHAIWETTTTYFERMVDLNKVVFKRYRHWKLRRANL